MYASTRTNWIGILLAVFLLSGPGNLHADPCSGNDPARCRIDIELHKSVVKRTGRPITRISIADPEIADYHLITPTQILLITKKKAGTTNLIVWYDDETIDVFEVRVFVAGDLIQSIQDALHTIVPQADIHMRQGPNGLMLFGEVDGQESLDTVLKLVSGYVQAYTNLITVRGSQQVQLSVRIAEVSRSGLKQMGLGFLTNRDWSVGVFNSGSVETSSTNVLTNGEATRYLGSALEISSPFSSAFQLAVHSLNDDFMGILSVLKQQNLARLLASPTLVTMSGQEASFLVGGEFPVPMESNDGQTSIDYKTFGIMLRFTPMVVAPETITVRVEPEISTVDYSLSVTSGGVSVPGLKTRRGSTTLQLKDGQTFVMAGLLQEDSSTVTNKIPFLGDIPYLGSLFTSKEFEKNESELMIIVTPRLVRALNPDEVPRLPGEGEMGVVGDADFFLKNRTEVKPDGDPESATGQAAEVPEMIGGNGFAN
ncbi:general secretion pathway protein [Desulfosarcina ovata subsp. sediminis]|uniref:General secretion pathway protein n=1 Tax=Desulfosarcina ovata subsp. sediminis TaxID=885957 RepID=A0A5K8A1P1_9BACT|nr:type II and III secretion system protein family protein [Desulfosarcina ovata]BBO86505.1 general secretion pathway protein [Desulfosarcina ovata subsp. sediminis]